MGTAIAEVLDAIPGGEVDDGRRRGCAPGRRGGTGRGARTLTPKVPVIAVTGTNGKTTTSRMIAHIARGDGRHVGWSSTDGIYIDGELVEAGDYSGPSGAGRVLAHPQVQLAVTETARGGILLKGIGLTRNDVSVVTNVTADHLGAARDRHRRPARRGQGRRPAHHPQGRLGRAQRRRPARLRDAGTIKAQPWVFSRDPDSPAIRETLAAGGRATTVIDGWIAVLLPNADPDPLVELVDVPMTLAGLSRFNVENALAAASAALASGSRATRWSRGCGPSGPGPSTTPAG